MSQKLSARHWATVNKFLSEPKWSDKELVNLLRAKPYVDNLDVIIELSQQNGSIRSVDKLRELVGKVDAAIAKTEKVNSNESVHKDVDIAERYVMKKKNALSRNKDFLLSFGEYKQLISRKVCFYTKLPMSGKNYLTLDRIDNSIGYTKENTVPCCNEFNQLKEHLFESENSFWLGKEEILLKALTKLIEEKKKVNKRKEADKNENTGV